MSTGAAKIGQPAPFFQAEALVDGKVKQVKLSDYKGKYVVLFFYPFAHLEGPRSTEIVAFSEGIDQFKKIGCEVIAFSNESADTLQVLDAVSPPAKIPILADVNHNIFKAYGCLKECIVPGRMAPQRIALHGQYIIDENGTLRLITISDMPPSAIYHQRYAQSVDDTLRLVQAFQLDHSIENLADYFNHYID